MVERGSGPRATINVLVAEDDADIRTTLGDALVDAGFTPTLVEDVAGALSAIARESFSAIVLDLNLGTDTAESILAGADPAIRPRVVLTTAAPSGPQVAARHGVHFLPKPFDLHALLELVATIASSVDRSSAAS